MYRIQTTEGPYGAIMTKEGDDLRIEDVLVEFYNLKAKPAGMFIVIKGGVQYCTVDEHAHMKMPIESHIYTKAPIERRDDV